MPLEYPCEDVKGYRFSLLKVLSFLKQKLPPAYDALISFLEQQVEELAELACKYEDLVIQYEREER